MDERTAAELDIVARTREWVREHFLHLRPEWRLEIDDPLFRNGVIDSIAVTKQTLAPLGAIAAFVKRKRHGAMSVEAGRPRRVA